MNELEFETTNRIRRRLGLTALIAATNSFKAVRFIALLLAALTDEDPYVRGMAVIALGELGDPGALPEIEKLSQDPTNERIMHLINNALRQLRSKQEAGGR